MQQSSKTAAPFDATAGNYDVEFSSTAVGRAQRKAVHTFLEKNIFPSFPSSQPQKALELNCGTGEDAVWLAKNNWQVLATDISPQMVAVTKKKAEANNVGTAVSTEVLGFHQIKSGEFKKNSQFSLVFSNFGGLNCISPKELAAFGQGLRPLCEKDAHFVAVVMGRCCWWESLYFLLKGNWGAAFRRKSKEAVTARLDDMTSVNTWYYSPDEFTKNLNSQLAPTQHWHVKSVEPIGFFLPPSYLDPFFKKKPLVMDLLVFLEKKCHGTWFSKRADHYLIHFTT